MVNTRCWEWKGRRDRKGYGRVYVSKRGDQGAHRIAWERAHQQQVPRGRMICHHCDNPPCVRPSHLFLGTAKSNIQDCIAKGRRGLLLPNAKLSPADVRFIRRSKLTQLPLMRMFGVSQPTISNILNRKTWKHI